MKKIFISALLAIAVSISSFAAGGNEVSYTVHHNFQAQFKSVSNVEWTSGENFTKATFLLNAIKTEAFFNADGEYIGRSQAVTLEELPVKAKRAFAKKYDGYTVKQAIRFEGVKDDSYYISAENEKGSVILKVEDNGLLQPANL